jgi:hypothetical protein
MSAQLMLFGGEPALREPPASHVSISDEECAAVTAADTISAARTMRSRYLDRSYW